MPSPRTAPKPLAFWAAAAALGLLWFRWFDHLRIEWSLNEQYAYGWAVPFLSALLLWRDQVRLGFPGQTPQSDRLAQFVMWLSLAWFWPTRFIAEANPDWRFISWTLTGIVVSVSVYWLARLGFSRRACVFPLAFCLVAVPWPTRMEQTIIQTLTQANSAATIEILNLAGIPALARGNVIEISTGLVGIDEACSGIRSLQATLMLSLFFGAWYRLRPLPRVATVALGFVLALLFNLGRTLLLVIVAVKQGVPAIDAWHDPAGITLLLGCFSGVWLGARALAKSFSASAPDRETPPAPASAPPFPRVLAGVTLGAIVLAELSCVGWYRWKEQQLPPAVTWQPDLAHLSGTSNPLPIAERTKNILRYSTAKNVAWMDPNGIRWQLIYLQWDAGRIAPHLARNHTPEVCLSAAGYTLESVSEVRHITVRADLTLPFRCYTFNSNGHKLFVFYSLREDRSHTTEFETESLTVQVRLAAVRDGRRNLGQRSLEIALWNAPNAETAELLLRAELEKLLAATK